MIEVTTRKMVDEAMSGQYRTHFKGQGVQFSEHRQYVPGDDIRHIDWKVSARAREPLIKKYEEERELVVLLVVDISASEGFGSQTKLKSEVLAEVAGMLSYAASHTGDKIGVILFGGQIEKVIPPKKGRSHVLRIVKELLTPRPVHPGTDLAGALLAAGRVMKHKGVVFVLSDFQAQGYDREMKRLARKHDVVAVQVGDLREKDVPAIGQLYVVDPETGEEGFIDTGSYAFKKWFKEALLEMETDFKTMTKAGGIDVLKVDTHLDYADAVVRFFRARARVKGTKPRG
ncbi:MAG: DUF58 domain-containing protein [Bdellovibrionales bacterium]|nr:DUF58 domain-containing protein [Bdellovibrionales bacterium]